jgi:hypothetical protein
MTKKTIAAIGVGISVLLNGCVPPPNPELERSANRPVICKTGPECDEYWSRAQVFVMNHSGYPIQIATDSIIQTYPASGGKPSLAWKIQKLKRSDGVSIIDGMAYCDNPFACRPEKWREMVSFKNFIKDGNID